MTIASPEATDPHRLKMSGMHMVALIAGVLATAGSHRLFGNIDHLWWGLAALAVGIILILVGAVGLGRSIHFAPVAAASSGYPTRLEGHLDPALSRGMWLVKWLLAIPHYIVLAILWAAVPVAVLAAGVMILFTGRYPASLFEFVVGVLRWNWRVVFYATGVLATDQYPPFTLARTDFPATFDVAYPDRLSRWKVLVKSWLLAFPHLIIVGILAGLFWVFSDGPGVGGLVGLLVFIAALILLFTGAYNAGLFNLVMGIHRWIYRVYAYTSLLRDDYPPFRLDQGPLETPAR
ncbi:hypothetical protein GCM10027052_31230 [Parafrigoribacterium mesophilum]|uniref:DUF4389 domain-containing protein n=1 Tax=Parafrigoribacterium mesophilum TaxID=433646 RepID=UPI0031FD12D5